MFSSNTSQVSSSAANFIEDVFSTWLYTGNGTSQTITNGIDAATKGALFWIKSRNSAEDNRLVDTVRGPNFSLASNNTLAQDNDSNRSITATTSGFTTGPTSSSPNASGTNYASWTFREQPKFFDVVTYTGNGSIGRQITHALGGNVGAVMIKATSTTGNWETYIRNAAGNYQYLLLNSTASSPGALGPTELCPTATTIEVAIDSSMRNLTNVNGVTYVMYLFAHNAGGFGLTGTDNVISCGSYAGNGLDEGPVINLGYEAQWVLVKRTDTSGDWVLFDNMRGMSYSNRVQIYPNLSSAELNISGQAGIVSVANGFQPRINNTFFNASGGTYIYIAIRRGPMRTPTTGTSVFAPVAWTGTGTGDIYTIPANFPVDMQITRRRGSIDDNFTSTRLFGNVQYLTTNTTNATTNLGSGNGTNNNVGFASNVGVGVTGDWNSGVSRIAECFRRAPGFMDVVCYTGTGSGSQSVEHNLGVAPELMLIKRRNAAATWIVGTQFTSSGFLYNGLTSAAFDSATYNGGFGWFSQPTAASFAVENFTYSGASGSTYVAYLFASCPGVSKVGVTPDLDGAGPFNIDCGFTGGARFVLIKRINLSGSRWFVFDTARGMSSTNDPWFALNNADAESTSSGDVINSVAGGFQLTGQFLNLAGNGIFVYLAIA